LGVVGVLIYLALVGLNLITALRLFFAARSTPYQLSALVLLAGIVSYETSHYYNRMFTDRPYWWMLVIMLAFEYYLLAQIRAAQVYANKALPVAAYETLPLSLADSTGLYQG
jgi:hypothetical protein